MVSIEEQNTEILQLEKTVEELVELLEISEQEKNLEISKKEDELYEVIKNLYNENEKLKKKHAEEKKYISKELIPSFVKDIKEGEDMIGECWDHEKELLEKIDTLTKTNKELETKLKSSNIKDLTRNIDTLIKINEEMASELTKTIKINQDLTEKIDTLHKTNKELETKLVDITLIKQNLEQKQVEANKDFESTLDFLKQNTGVQIYRGNHRKNIFGGF